MLRKMGRAWVGGKAYHGKTQMYTRIRICSGLFRRSMAAGVRQGITRRTVAIRPRMLRRMVVVRLRTTPDITGRIPGAIVLRIRDRRVQVMDIRDMRLRGI